MNPITYNNPVQDDPIQDQINDAGKMATELEAISQDKSVADMLKDGNFQGFQSHLEDFLNIYADVKAGAEQGNRYYINLLNNPIYNTLTDAITEDGYGGETLSTDANDQDKLANLLLKMNANGYLWGTLIPDMNSFMK